MYMYIYICVQGRESSRANERACEQESEKETVCVRGTVCVRERQADREIKKDRVSVYIHRI